jgi:SAM-dependent methyltransferase
VWEALRDALAARPGGAAATTVLDVGGGTGGFAVPLAELGCPVEVVDDPAAALAGLAAVLRPGGIASVLVANRIGATAARVAAGRLAEAGQMMRSDAGVSGPSDPVRRRFTPAELQSLIAAAGLQPVSTHGVRVFFDSAPDAVLDTDPDALDELLALEHAAAEDPAYLGLAAALHVLAVK